MALISLQWKDVCGRMLQSDLPTVPQILVCIDCHYLFHIICLENGNPAAENLKPDLPAISQGKGNQD